jgi:hypothetical protein
MESTNVHTPNPRRVAAGRLNRAQRGSLTDAGRERLRQAALLNRPWQHSTGPRTPAGRAQSVLNGKRRQRGPQSIREIRAELKEVRELVRQMRQARAVAAGG